MYTMVVVLVLFLYTYLPTYVHSIFTRYCGKCRHDREIKIFFLIPKNKNAKTPQRWEWNGAITDSIKY